MLGEIETFRVNGKSVGVVSIFYSNISRLNGKRFMFCDIVRWQIVKKFHASAYAQKDEWRYRNGRDSMEMHTGNRNRSQRI